MRSQIATSHSDAVERTSDAYQAPRLATLDDIDVLVRHRAEMFAGMGKERDAIFDAMVRNSGGWFRKHLKQGTYLGFLISPLGQSGIVAGAGLLLMDWPPTCADPHTTRGYILNVYVEPEHRARGLARQATEACVAACRERGIVDVTLHSAAAARSIYERLGFVATNEMRLRLPVQPRTSCT